MWPPTKQLYDAVDVLHRKLILGLLHLQRLGEETEAQFHARRHHIAATHAAKHLKWSDRFLLRAHAWNSHCLRGHVSTPASLHLQEGREGKLEKQRLAFILANGTMGDSISIAAGRLGTRFRRGRPPMRYEEGIKRSKERHEEVVKLQTDKRLRHTTRKKNRIKHDTASMKDR